MAVRMPLGKPPLNSRVPSFMSWLHLWCQVFLLVCILGSSRSWSCTWVLATRHRWTSWLLVSPWPRFSCCRHLRHESAGGRFLCLCVHVSPCISKKNFNKRKIKILITFFLVGSYTSMINSWMKVLKIGCLRTYKCKIMCAEKNTCS